MTVSTAYRILDANLNRLREGLRTTEEHFRFVEENPRAARVFKHLRHDLIEPESLLDRQHLLQARNSRKDIGKVTSRQESSRSSLHSVLIANFKRCQESARVLEEYAKLISIKSAEKFKRIRFKLYDAEKKYILK